MSFIRIAVVLVCLVGVSAAALAQTTQPSADGAPPKGLTVAVLDFSTREIESPELGSVIGETVAIMLANESGLVLVDRSAIEKTLREQELTLSGLVDTEQAISVGKLVGARIIVVGRAFQLGESLFITAKLIGTETTLVDGVLVKGNSGEKMDELVMSIAQQIAERLRTRGASLVASTVENDPLPGLKEALAGRALPTVAVVIGETHISSAPPNTMDPAVETEMKRLLLECGVVVKDMPHNQLADWASRTTAGAPAPWPQGLENVDWVITGEGFSEYATRVGNLHTCTARVEINVIDRATGNIVKADRHTTRAVDLSENLAGRTALQKAGDVLGVRLLEYMRDRPE